MTTITSAPAVAPEETRGRRQRPGAVPILIVVALLAVGGWLRFASLERLSFWADEFPHAMAARSLLHDGRPTLPSGREYRRALPQTVVVAASMRLFGENERAARLPSAVVGLATIPVLWLLVRRRFGEAAGLASAAALTVMPLHVAHARSARFYAAFVLAYGLAAVTASHAIESRSRRAAILAAIAFGAAMLLQVLALMLIVPLAAHALWHWRRSADHERRAHGRALLLSAGVVAVVALTVVSIPSVRDGLVKLVREPIPGLRLGPGVHLETFLKPFEVVSWWAWIPLLPLVFLGVRRAGTWGQVVCVHLLAPAALMAILFEPTTSRGVDVRYLLHLIPFVAVLAGIGCAEGARRLTTVLRRPDEAAILTPVAVATAVFVVAGITGVWRLPSEPHPGRLIPRPNWDAAGSVLRAEMAPGDALLSTSPLALSWETGRCGEWLREARAAAMYMDGDRDIYCGTTLLSDGAAVERYLVGHPRGWVVADPRQWAGLVDPAASALLERVSHRIDVGDPSILVLRWGV